MLNALTGGNSGCTVTSAGDMEQPGHRSRIFTYKEAKAICEAKIENKPASWIRMVARQTLRKQLECKAAKG